MLEKPSGLATQDVPARLNALLGRSACAPVWLPHRLDKYTQGLQVTSRGARALEPSADIHMKSVGAQW